MVFLVKFETGKQKKVCEDISRFEKRRKEECIRGDLLKSKEDLN